MNTPKPKQLNQRRPKQREIVPPKYRLRIDRRRLYPHLPRDLIRKQLPEYARTIYDIGADEEGHKEDKA